MTTVLLILSLQSSTNGVDWQYAPTNTSITIPWSSDEPCCYFKLADVKPVGYVAQGVQPVNVGVYWGRSPYSVTNWIETPTLFASPLGANDFYRPLLNIQKQ